jgi:MAF protein
MDIPIIVLASNSPRRRSILSWLDLPFTTTSADIDESPAANETPAEYVMRLATEKAHACARFAPFGGVVLAADTTVADGDKIIGKPADEEDAERILKQLRKRTHMVHTAIVLITPSRGTAMDDICSTAVKMRSYTDEEIKAYLTTGDAMDKAGAYAIQNTEFHPVEKMNGCFASVMGLPLCHLERTLRKMGFGSRSQVPYRCQRELAYTCPIFKRVLSGEDIG